MAFAIVMSLVTAWVLLIQGIYVVRTGQTTLFFMRQLVHSHPPLRLPLKLAYASIYLFPSVAIMAILAAALKRAGVGQPWGWAVENSGMILWSAFFALIGVLLLAQPEKMLRWTIRTSPGIADNKSVLVITRLIGVGILGMALAMIAKL